MTGADMGPGAAEGSDAGSGPAPLEPVFSGPPPPTVWKGSLVVEAMDTRALGVLAAVGAGRVRAERNL